MINPFGGAGAAAANWNIARPFLEKAHVAMTIKHTERRNHAYDIVHDDLLPNQFDAIVTVSGDGLIHEVVNGLCTRDDWAKFKETITVGVIPGGTGNGLVKSLVAATGDEYSILNATFKVAKGVRGLMDMTELNCEYERNKIYSFLSTQWAIIADIDINSEAIRCCGATRFTVWGVWRTLFKRHYRGSFKYRGKEITHRN